MEADDPRLARALYANEFFQEAKLQLELNGDSNYKLLLSGHTGCGKSTFLNLLAADPEVSRRFHLVKYSVKDLLDVNDIDHVDLLLSIAAQAITSIDEPKLKAIQPLLEVSDEERFDEALRDLLHMPALFQYRNGEIKWYRPYPVFIDWLATL